MVFVFDIDGTVLESMINDDRYRVTGYNVKIMLMINDLYKKGHTIIFQTARHWDKFERTKEQLGEFKYHTLVMGNIPADYYINDKGITPQGFIELYEAKLKKEEN